MVISCINSHQWPMFILHRAYLQAGKRGKMLRDVLIMSIITIALQLGLGLSCRYELLLQESSEILIIICSSFRFQMKTMGEDNFWWNNCLSVKRDAHYPWQNLLWHRPNAQSHVHQTLADLQHNTSPPLTSTLLIRRESGQCKAMFWLTTTRWLKADFSFPLTSMKL